MPLLVAYELSITELKNQRIVRVWEGLASPLAHLTNKILPQVSWEIASKAPAHSKKEISLRDNEFLVFSNALLLPKHHVSQDVPHHAKSCGFRGKLTAARPLVDPIQSSMEYRIEPCCQGALTLRRMLRNPRSDHWLYIDILLREEDYAQATDGCGRSKTKIVCLEDEIHIDAKIECALHWAS